jgi:hypothetical protein
MSSLAEQAITIAIDGDCKRFASYQWIGSFRISWNYTGHEQAE